MSRYGLQLLLRKGSLLHKDHCPDSLFYLYPQEQPKRVSNGTQVLARLFKSKIGRRLIQV
jgi:hypothetical protein